TDPQPNTLWKLIEGVYRVLNVTNPKFTEQCWLCFSIRPPFYEAIGVLEKARRVEGSNPPQCTWNDTQTHQGLTLSAVTWKGLCIG
ncbi:ENV1 protein, partial [Leptocoma aspasia]|nr:ENV1 protein [Leptocoma aspasia]